MKRGLVLGLVLAVLVTAAWAALPAVALTDDTPSNDQVPLTGSEEFESTTFEITVFENGSAEWTVQHSRPLANSSEVEDFETFAEEFNAGNATIFEDFETRARRLVANKPASIERNMSATNFSKRARYPGQQRGFVDLSFRWSNFAETDDDEVRVGDVFQNGLLILENQALEIHHREGIRFTEVEPEPDEIASPGNLSDSESVTWEGRIEFSNNRPLAVLESSTATDDEVVAANGGSPQDGGMGVASMLAVGLVILVGVGGAAWYTGRLPIDGSVLPNASTPERSPPGPDADGQTVGPTTTGSEDLLSDEDHVLELLEENGGRMKQVNIVESTEWSKSKVSMLLSDMEDEGEISKLRVGRENIISLAGEEPDAAGSPFEEE